MATFIENFGRDVRFTTENYFEPHSEEELLEILQQHKGRQIRAIGSKHAWNRGIVSEEAVVSLHHLNDVTFEVDDTGDMWATVGGGCQIKHLIPQLNDRGVTTPSIGLITEQTIAGAISTGTHGSGKQSLSHYMDEIRIAHYDRVTGDAVVTTVNSGDELLAARCSLGCMGIIVSVKFRCRPQYTVTEFNQKATRLQQVLEWEQETPLQQFFLMPHSWTWYAQRRIANENQTQSKGLAWLFHIHWFLSLDIGLHLAIKFCASWMKSRWLIHLLYKRLVPLTVITGWKVTDRSDKMLTMEHELFRHLEIEVFVKRSQLSDAAEYIKQILQICGGNREQFETRFQQQVADLGLTHELDQITGTFHHHYPICFRRILPDATLISMASGESDDWYSISFITYQQPREQFFNFASLLAHTMGPMFEARIHWGKYFPLSSQEIEKRYPRLEDFREICGRFDPDGRFQNEFTRNALGFEMSSK